MTRHILRNLKTIIVTIVFLTSAMLSHSACASIFYQHPTFLKNHFLVGIYDNGLISDDTYRPPSPIFWSASTKADHGFMIMYRRLLWHSQKYFSLDAGTSFSRWVRSNQSIYAFSLFLDIRFWLFHTRWFSPYIIYSIAGPTFLTRDTFGPAKLGAYFLFQDYLGIGAQFGIHDPLTLSVLLWHYSNGDIFIHNNGFDVPLVFSIGLAI